MKNILLPKNILVAGLLLVSIHSFLVGMALIFGPAKMMELFGFVKCNECFFRYQGGVFHVIMAYAYTAGAINPLRNEPLIKFSIAAKLTAVLFLFLYYSFVSHLGIILFSGIGDLLMAVMILFLFIKFKHFNS